MASEEARQQAQAEKLTLLVAKNKTGYFGVRLTEPGLPKPYQARVTRGGKSMSLGSFATAEEAALCVARSPEGQAAAAAAPLTSEEARQQAQAEKLTLRLADNKTGYYGVCLAKPGQARPYQAGVTRGGNTVGLGSFATAEEAALCVARSPEGRAAAAERAAAAAPLTNVEARQQAQAEGLTLRLADSKTGYIGVHHQTGRPKPYQAQVKRGGKDVYLGRFITAEEAALCVARSPEGQALAAERAAEAAPLTKAAPLTSEEARQQAQAENLTLLVAKTGTGYFGVFLDKRGKAKPFKAQLRRDGKNVSLGYFATAEEAALYVARSPEGQAVAAERPVAAVPLTSGEARQQAQAEGLTLVVAKNRTGYFGVQLSNPGRPRPYQVVVNRNGKAASLGCFATAEEAALCMARSPEGHAVAAERAAAAVPLTRKEARQQARAEGLTLRLTESKTGYFGVYLNQPGTPKPYQVQVSRGGKAVARGCFATAEEAALCVARSEGRQQAAAAAAAAERAVEERAAVMYRAAEQALAALGKGKKRCR